MTHWKRGFAFILLNSLLLLLSACFGGTAQPAQLTFGSDVRFEPGSTANLICSGACFDRAQCGRNQQQEQDVVLLSTIGPAVTGHDRWQPNNTQVTITTSQTRTVHRKQNVEDQYPIEFYQVQLPNAEQAWVGGWCIHQ